jgi:CTP:molybdopterin cytidylyltransferase MocA
MNTDIAEVIPNNPNTLLNVNTPEEMLHLLQAFPKIKS